MAEIGQIICGLSAKIASVWQPLIDYTLNSSFYHQFGLAVVFLYSMTPSVVFIPNEVFWISIYNATPVAEQHDLLFKVWLLTTTSGFIGDSLVYLGAYHGYRYFKKEENEADQKMKKWVKRFHRHKYWLFIVAPNIFGLEEAAVIFAGINKIKWNQFALYLFLGNGLRNAIGIALVASGMQAFNFFC